MADLQSVTTGKVRLSFVHLLSPYKKKDALPTDEPKYMVTILIPKSDIRTMQGIEAAKREAVEQGIKAKWRGVRPPKLLNTIHDGDGDRPTGEPFGAECRGHWVITASSKDKPFLADVYGTAISNPAEVYSGMYALALLRFYAFDGQQKGVTAAINGIIKVEDGEKLGGGGGASINDFAEQINAYMASAGSSGYIPPQQQAAPYTPGYAAPQQQAAPYTPPQQVGYAPVSVPTAAPTGAPMFDPLTGQPIAPIQTPSAAPMFDPLTGQPIAPVAPPVADTPRFDPLTGQPILAAPPAPRFDPLTGLPINNLPGGIMGVN